MGPLAARHHLDEATPRESTAAPGRRATWGLACSLAALLPLADGLVGLALQESLFPDPLDAVLLLSSPVLATIGVVLSVLALRHRTGRRGRAVGGLVLGAFWLAWVLVLVVLLTAA